MKTFAAAALALAALLAACGRAPDPAPALRDTSRPMYSSTSFDIGQLDGIWQQRGTVGGTGACSPGGLDLQSLGNGRVIGSWILCLGDLRCAGQGELAAIGPGRFALPELDEPVWVLWTDADNRTLVLGTPSGAFGLVLDRKGDIPQDRRKAAADVLAWNGYDAGLLRFWPN